MNITKEHPVYKIQLEPEDIGSNGTPIGDNNFTKEEITFDLSKLSEQPEEGEIYSFIADNLAIDKRYMKAQWYDNLLTWAKLRDFINRACLDYVEVSSIEVHYYGSTNYNINVRWTDSGKLIITDGY